MIDRARDQLEHGLASLTLKLSPGTSSSSVAIACGERSGYKPSAVVFRTLTVSGSYRSFESHKEDASTICTSETNCRFRELSLHGEA
jgi:hypothetical protein